MESLWPVVKIYLGLELVVLVHMLGHLLSAKLFRVPVEFRLGLGPAIPGCRLNWGRSTLVLAFLPLGGYVKLANNPRRPGEISHILALPPLWRRLGMVAGGWVMNVVFAWACFCIWRGHGVERPSPVIGMVAPGSPAWEAGLPSGAVIHQIDDVKTRSFQELMVAAMGSHAGQKLQLVYSLPNDAQPTTRSIEPRVTPATGRPMLGVSPAVCVRLASRAALGGDLPWPAIPNSAADRVVPPFEFSDVVIGSTDPDEPARVKPLAEDPRNPGGGLGDYFELDRRFRLLAGKEITLQVRRADGGEEMIRVPPAYHLSLGVRMRMGPIAAIRRDSPAAKAELRTAGVGNRREADVIVSVTLPEADGRITRLDANNLDPLRLPYELRQWAWRMARAGKAADRVVTLQVRRENRAPGPQFQDVGVRLTRGRFLGEPARSRLVAKFSLVCS
jgi:hypothetical protein